MRDQLHCIFTAAALYTLNLSYIIIVTFFNTHPMFHHLYPIDPLTNLQPDFTDSLWLFFTFFNFTEPFLFAAHQNIAIVFVFGRGLLMSKTHLLPLGLQYLDGKVFLLILMLFVVVEVYYCWRGLLYDARRFEAALVVWNLAFLDAFERRCHFYGERPIVLIAARARLFLGWWGDDLFLRF